MKILSVCHALPSKKVFNEDLITKILEKSRPHLNGTSPLLEEKLRSYFDMAGTQVRYHRDKNERAIDFALKAAKDAIKKSGLKPKEIDLLIYAGVGRGWMEPATANVFQDELDLNNATCFDVMDACASWVRSMYVASSFLKSGMHKNILIINCEFNERECSAGYEMRRVDDVKDLFAGCTIGEAATATVVQDSPDEPIISIKSWGSGYKFCIIPLANVKEFSTSSKVDQMKPHLFYADATKLLTFTMSKLKEHYWSVPALQQQYDLAIGHTVSVPSTYKTADLLKIDHSLVFETHSRFGNTVSASLPLAMSVAEQEGRLKRGMNLLLVMGSAGVTTGFISLRY